ncbi:MAG: 1,4-dihydroxy-6-naphthoate synthase [Chitinophagia bacterium]|jgi:1,4-dihydroxy-6-naphthoate synthase
MKLTIGISPCPNDTYIFDAMLHGKIDTEGLAFEYRLEDVETLNRMALRGDLDISKVSYGGVSKMLQHYKILDAGGALGNGVGPLFVSHKYSTSNELDPETSTIVLPGNYTTAHLLFSLSFPDLKQKSFVPFDEIETMVLNAKADAGVIIHENRFTYQERGLNKLADLGELWEAKTGLPIPLGGILARRKFSSPLLQKINRVIKRSLEYAISNKENLADFVKENAQEMSEEVMRKHIALYVNNHSLGLGPEGRAAIWKLLETSVAIHPEPFGWNFEVFAD